MKRWRDDIRYRWEALCDLYKRYKEVFIYFWHQRKELDAPDLKSHEAQFLPSALALQAAPVSPAGRWVARILMGLLLTLLLWSVLGQVDIIVNGQGKIIVGGHTKTIASVELAKVLDLYVQEGQLVKAGDLLIELDARAIDSERDKAEGDRQLALLQMERAKALLGAINLGANQINFRLKEPTLNAIEGIDEAHYQNEVNHLADQWRDFIAKHGRIASQISRYSAALPLAKSRADDYAQLLKTRDVSGHAYLEKEQARIDIQGQLDDARTQLSTLIAETRKTAQEELYQATRIWSGAKQDIKKASVHGEQLRINAPVDGVVQQLSVHTIGGVVPAAQPLMLIVPSTHTVELEAYVENKDIGFMREGQDAQVKIDAFEYTKYGTIPAKVTHVSRDAIDLSGGSSNGISNGTSAVADKGAATKGGLMYAIKVTLDKPYMVIDGKEVALSPGMSGSVEIKTGSRRIIEYVLSPLIMHSRESLRER